MPDDDTTVHVGDGREYKVGEVLGCRATGELMKVVYVGGHHLKVIRHWDEKVRLPKALESLLDD